jgi:hypothetical protein
MNRKTFLQNKYKKKIQPVDNKLKEKRGGGGDLHIKK